jgi:hypothetical protein
VHQRQSLPEREDQGDALLALKDFAKSLFEEHKVQRVGILCAVGGMYSSSPERVKIECAIQIGARESHLSVLLVTPQGLRAIEKKFEAIAGGTPEHIFLNGGDFKPKALRDAAIVAYIGLDPE